MTVAEKYLGKSLDDYLKSIEPKILQLKNYIIISKIIKIILGIILIIIVGMIILLNNLDTFFDIKIEQIFSTIFHLIDIIAILVGFLFICEKKIKSVTMKLLSDYIGGMEPINSNKYPYKNSDAKEEFNHSPFSFSNLLSSFGLNFDSEFEKIDSTVSYAFNVKEENFSYDIYYVETEKTKIKNNREFKIKIFDGVVVIFETLPVEIIQSVISKNNDKIKCINKQMVYTTSKINDNKLEILETTDFDKVKKWAEKTIIELVKMKEYIKTEIKTMKIEIESKKTNLDKDSCF